MVWGGVVSSHFFFGPPGSQPAQVGSDPLARAVGPVTRLAQVPTSLTGPVGPASLPRSGPTSLVPYDMES